MQAAQVLFNTVPTTNWVFTSICNVGSKKPNAIIKEATTKSTPMDNNIKLNKSL